MSKDEDRAWRLLETVSGWLRHAEAKLTAALGFIGVTGGALFGISKGADFDCWSAAVAWLGAITVIAAGLVTLAGLLPRRRSVDPHNVVFYRDIFESNATSADYTAKVRKATKSDDFEVAILKQVYNVSRVADRKFAAATHAFVLLGIALTLTALLGAARAAGAI